MTSYSPALSSPAPAAGGGHVLSLTPADPPRHDDPLLNGLLSSSTHSLMSTCPVSSTSNRLVRISSVVSSRLKNSSPMTSSVPLLMSSVQSYPAGIPSSQGTSSCAAKA